MCTALESVSARAQTANVALGSLKLPDAEEFLNLSDAVAAVEDYQLLFDAAESLLNFVAVCSQELSGADVDAVDSPKLCVFAAAAECCQEPVAGGFPRPSDVAVNFQGLFVDAVDPQVPSVAVDVDSPVYSALAAAVADWLEMSHFHPTLNCSCFPGRVAEGSPQTALGYKVQSLAAVVLAALLLLSLAVQPHPGAKAPEPVAAGMEDYESLCPPIPFHFHPYCCLLETKFLGFPAKTAEGPEVEPAGEPLCLLTRTLGTMQGKECPASEWWTRFLES